MTAAVYRYKRDSPGVNLAKLQRMVGGLALSAGTPMAVYHDQPADTTQKNDLDEAMASLGWAYDSTNPSNTPNQQGGSLLGTTFDPRSVRLHDPLVTGNVDLDELGALGWRTETAGTGSNILLRVPTAGKPGGVRLEAGTTANAYAAIHLGDGTVGTNFMLTGQQNPFRFGYYVRFENSIASVDLEIFQGGFGREWTAVGELAYGVYIRFVPNLLGTKTFELVFANNSTRSACVGTTVVQNATDYFVEGAITWTGGTPSGQLYVNGTSEGTAVTANMPTLGIAPGFKHDSVGSVLAEPWVDVRDILAVQA